MNEREPPSGLCTLDEILAEAKRLGMTLPELPLPMEGLRRPEAFVQRVAAGIGGPFIHNVVMKCQMDTNAPMHGLVYALGGSKNSRDFAAPTRIKNKDPSIAVQMYDRGSVVMTSANDEDIATMLMHRFVQRVLEVSPEGTYCYIRNTVTCNLHTTMEMHWHLNLRALAPYAHGYNPSLINQVKFVVRLGGKKKATFVIYDTGRIVLEGLTLTSECRVVARYVARFLAHFVTVPVTKEEVEERVRTHLRTHTVDGGSE